jgi:EpsI family protein
VRFETLPAVFETYRGTEKWFSPEVYEVLHADTTTYREYVNPDGDFLWFFAAYFGAQNFGEQIHSPRNCLPGGGWNILSLDRIPLAIPGKGEIVANRLLIESGQVRQVMYYFFITRLGTVASEYRLKFELAKAALSFEPRDALFVRLSTPVSHGDEAKADENCKRFLSRAMPLLYQGLPF